MSEYCNKIKQPLSNIRRWISDLNLGNTPIASTLVSTLRPDTDVARAATPSQPDSDLTTEASAQDSLLPQRDSANMSASTTAMENSELETIKQSLDSIKVCSNISKTQMKEFREAFGFFDKDGDGFITKDELGIVMRSLGQFASEEELKEMLKEVDINGDGLFSFDEFVEIVSNYSGNTSGGNTNEEQELRDAFRIFDKHNRGYISASDLRAVLHCLGEDLSEDEIEDMIKEVDVDGDGRIDFNEFVRALGEPDEADDDEGDSKPQD